MIKAVSKLTRSPRAYSVIEALDRYSASDERIEQCIRVLHAIVSKPSDELRWSYQPTVMRKLLERGFASANPGVHQLTDDVQELLLRQGLFEYLDVNPQSLV